MRIKFIFHKFNRNGAAARNTGFIECTGEYISLLDDDDIYLPGRLEKSVNHLSKQKKIIGAVYCGFLGWNSPVNDTNRYKEGDLSKELLLLDFKKHYMHTNTATYTREAYLALNGFDESYRRHQDLEFNLRFFTEYRVRAFKECLVKLNPEKSNVDNKVYGMDMFNLKMKFLDDFQYTIKCLSQSEQNSIYLKHWAEVKKYAADHDKFYSILRNDVSNGHLQLELMKP